MKLQTRNRWIFTASLALILLGFFGKKAKSEPVANATTYTQAAKVQ